MASARASSGLTDSARARLAQLEGVTVVPGLDSAVEVRRDRWGVPHIYAKTQHDLFLAQGYVAAQDRLWQMDVWRRIGEGRLAEVIGPAGVDRDRFARLLKYRGDMDAEWKSYAPDAREIVHAFVEGVNAYIAQVRDRPPIEFSLLRVVPEPWTPEVPLQRMAALAMTGNALDEVTRARLVHLVGVDKVEALWPTDPYRRLDPAAGLDLVGINSTSLGAARESYRAVTFDRLEGSNNWVVSGAKTATGKPLLANDPHRAITLPSLRYLTHLVGPGWNVIGAGEPALPGVAGGHNERIGFGFTIVGMDQQDVYVERVRPCRTGKREQGAGGTKEGATRPNRSASIPVLRCYLHRGAWKPIRTIVDTIRVKGEAPRMVLLEFTEHGPIVAEDRTRGRAFVVRFVGSEPGTAGYLAQIALNRATDWPSFLAAAARWKLPTENLVYGDVDGNIGWVAAGLMPVRHWSGLLPVPGDGRFEWRGFLDFMELPRTYNPPSGMIVTANNNILPAGYAKPLNYEWAPPYRAQRITDVLTAGSALTRADFERLQHDEYSLPASRLVPILVSAASRRGVSGRPDVRALATWNFVMARDSLAPLLYEAWLNALAKRVFLTRVPASAAPLIEDDWRLPVLVDLMTTPDSGFGAGPMTGRDSVAVLALDDAIRDLSSRLGPPPWRLRPAACGARAGARTPRHACPRTGQTRARWTWGALHQASFEHPLAAAFDLPTVPRGGDGNTVNATGGGDFRQQWGASFRVVLDFANWDNSVATSTPGQSGQPGSVHYGDLLPLWSEGRYFPLVYTRARVEKETKHVLILTP